MDASSSILISSPSSGAWIKESSIEDREPGLNNRRSPLGEPLGQQMESKPVREGRVPVVSRNTRQRLCVLIGFPPLPEGVPEGLPVMRSEVGAWLEIPDQLK